MPGWPWTKRKEPTAVAAAPAAAGAGAATQRRLDMVINPMDYSGKDTVLDVVRTERAKFYAIIDDPNNWEAPTRSGHWQVRDLVGHMIDVTEGYLSRWDMARRQEEAGALGLLVMAGELDRVALT